MSPCRRPPTPERLRNRSLVILASEAGSEPILSQDTFSAGQWSTRGGGPRSWCLVEAGVRAGYQSVARAETVVGACAVCETWICRDRDV